MRSICAVLLALALLTVLSGCATVTEAPPAVSYTFSEQAYVAYTGEFVPGEAPEQMEFVAAKGYVAMFYDPATADFVLEDMRTGERYSSRSLNETDTMQERSQLIVTDLDVDSGNTRTRYSADATVSTAKTENGFQVWYVFQEEQYAIPVEYLLLEDGFRVRVRCSHIKEQGEVNRVAAVSVLPYLYAQKEFPAGFMLVPDGSGALIRLDRDKSSYEDYEGALYGDSYLSIPDYRTAVTEACLLPFAGMQTETGGFLAMAEAGASAGSVLAAVEGQDTAASHVGFRFALRQQQEAYIGNPESADAKTVLVNEEGPITLSDVSVRYFLLDSTPETGLAAMASVARAVVADVSGGVTAAPASDLYLTTLGGYTVEEPVLGFRMPVTKSVTTVKAASAMLEKLQKQGADRTALIYTGYNRAALRGELTATPQPDGAVGSVSELKALAEQLGENRLLLSVEPETFRADGGGYNADRMAIRDMNLETVEVFRYRRNNTHADRSNPSYLLKVDRASSLLGQMTAWIAQNTGATPLVSGYGTKLYGDFSAGGYTREQALQLVQSTLQAQGAAGTLCTETAHYSAALYSSVIVNVPGYSSDYDVFDETVPFYQMVFSGTRALVSQPLNRDGGDTDRAFLDCVRFGMVPHFELIAEDQQMLGDYGVDRFYAASAAVWSDRIAGYHSRYQKVYDAVNGRALEQYQQVSEGVYRLTYAGGVQVLVNETDAPVTVAEQTVAAGDLAVVV